MKLSKRWLNDYVKPNVGDQAFADAMTLSGSKVESWAPEGADIENVVVGRVVSIERHPDSDHLRVCRVDVGTGETLQVITGAQNVRPGDFVPAALDGGAVAGGRQIKKGKLRGLPSDGMLCSLAELGLTAHDFPGAAEDGIFILGGDCERIAGLDIHKAIGLNDVVTEFEITSNRPDCLSVAGLAREAAATFGAELHLPEPEVRKTHGDIGALLSVENREPSLCYRYAGAVVENVRIGPSPRWLRERLRASGVRPINNIVDITNFVMLEFGQPMHAFDLRLLKDGKLVVRRAAEGEKLTTLDGAERGLSPEMLVIADAEKPVAVAGIMGGEYAGVTNDTDSVVFESAVFNAVSVRRTSRNLGLRTESSLRYEKGLDANGCLRSLTRALQLVEKLDAGDVVGGVVDCDAGGRKPVTLPFRPDWVNGFLGIDLPAGKQAAILEKLGFGVENGVVTVPSFRGDIEHQADISEEIARFYGYDKIPDRALVGVADGGYTGEQKLENEVHRLLTAEGLSEICTYTFISPKAYDRLRLPEDSHLRRSVKILNPLGEDTSVMRTTLLPSMLEVLGRNYNNRNPEAALYEIAPIYLSRGERELPDEPKVIVLGLYGESYDFFALKGVVEELLKKLGVEGYETERVSDEPAFHLGRAARFVMDGEELALFGEIHPEVRDSFGVGVRCFAAQLSFSALLKNRRTQKLYAPLPKFPAIVRDLAFVCGREVPVGRLEKEIKSAVGGILEDLSLFDVYEGSQIEAGRKSAAFSLRLRSKERTLTDEEADAAVKRVIRALKKLGAALRA